MRKHSQRKRCIKPKYFRITTENRNDLGILLPPSKEENDKGGGGGDERHAPRAIKIAEKKTRIGAKREIERSINRNRLRRAR